MRGSKRVILHIVFDGIFFDGISNRFDEMESYDNMYLYKYYGMKYLDQPFKYIKNFQKIVIAKDEIEWGHIICNPEVDIIYLHGVWVETLRCFKYIRKDTIVVWWCYGREIYENCLGVAPLLPMKLLKPRTFWFKQRLQLGNLRQLLVSNIEYFTPTFLNHLRKLKKCNRERESLISSMLERVDYLFTPLPIEYDILKKKVRRLKAKPFRLYPPSIIKYLPVEHDEGEGILFDHSAMLTNNHLDTLHALSKNDLSGRKIYIPLSYGDNRVKDEMKKHDNFCGSETIFIEDSLPFEEYKSMLRNCSHALFGPIRQSALGNISLCFQFGVKVFLFKNSILYKYYKNKGYYVYSIDDLTQQDISKPLTMEEMTHNSKLYYSFWGNHSSYDEQFNKLIEEHNKKFELNG